MTSVTTEGGGRDGMLYEGKAKIIRPGKVDGEVLIHFKDDATAFNGVKKDVIQEKGRLNARISGLIMTRLADAGIPTHFLEQVDERTHRALRLEMIPLEVVVRNKAAGSLVRRFGFQEGQPLDPPIVELYLKDDDRGDPMLTLDHIRALGLGDAQLVEDLRHRGLAVNRVLGEIFGSLDIILVDFKLEFGRRGDEIVLGDEVTPDTCRFWDSKTGEKLDKDRFRFDLGDLVTGYAEIERRLESPTGA